MEDAGQGWIAQVNLELSIDLVYALFLNVGHTIRYSILYVLAGKPPLSVYITKSMT